MEQNKARKEMARMAIKDQEKHGNRLDAQSRAAVKEMHRECQDYRYYSEHQRDFHF